MSILTILLFGIILIVLVIGAFFGLIFLNLFIYAVSHVYPWLRKIAVWAAKPENLFSLVILAVVFIIVIILGLTLLRGLGIVGTLLVLMIVPVPILLFVVADLGILVWILRLLRWIYQHWRGVLVSIYTAIRLQVIKFKIKVDVQKETDWKVKFAEMKNKLSGEAEQARRKISRRGK